MKYKLIFIVLMLLLLQNASAYFKADGKYILDNNGEKILLRGMGLGGWIFPEGYMVHMPGFGSPTAIREMITDVIGESNTQQFYEAFEYNYVNERDVQQLKDWGFNHLRVPFSYKLFYDNSTATFREEGFDFFNNFLQWCKNSGIYIILDMHGAPGGQNTGPISDSDGIEARLWTEPPNQDLAVLIWTEIASRYATEELIIGYDLINEPVLPDGYSASALRSLYIRLTNAIRQVDPNHMIFIEGNWYATDFTLLTPPWDNNMAYSFHKYWNETDVGTIQYLLNIRDTYNVPLWLGETGENSNSWFYETVRLMENYEIGWCWWTHKKLGTTTSPLSAKVPEGFSDLQQYWSGQATKPTVEYAKSVLMQFAENFKLENCEPRPGVIPALFSPTFGVSSVPVKYLKIPGSIAAVDYNIGTQGIAYFDSDYENIRGTSWNNGWQHRNDGVDIESSGDAEGPEKSVGWINSGEWLLYTINAEASGTYNVYLRVGSESNDGKIRMLVDGLRELEDYTVISTGGLKVWETQKIGTVAIEEGEHTIALQFLNEGFNINEMRFVLEPDEEFDELSADLYVGNLYPNPVRGKTILPVVSNTSGKIILEFFDSQGRKLEETITREIEPGNFDLEIYTNQIHSTSLAAGIYFVRVNFNNKSMVKKITIW